MTTLNVGNGLDGDAIASSNTNLNTTSLVGRGYGDMVSFSCSSVGVQGCTLTATPNGLNVGDEVLLINVRGVGYNGGTSVANEGNYETFEISDINGTDITFATLKTKLYGDDGGDTNIGINVSSNQKVMLQRVPNYNNLTINGGISIYNNNYSPKDGVIFFRVKETLTINGNIDVTGHGPLPGGVNAPTANIDGGIGHPLAGSSTSTGTGASHATQGQQKGTAPAPTYGNQELTKLHMGSSGASGDDLSGGRGGGVIAFFTATLHLYGALYAKGFDGGEAGASDRSGGGGSGGSILIQAGTLYMHSSTTNVVGGDGGGGNRPGGDAGEGRLAIYYATLGDSITGADVTPYVDDTLELPYFISGTVSEACAVRIYDTDWVFVKSSTVSGAGAYSVLNLPSEGPFFVIGTPDSTSVESLIYRNIISAQ